MFAPQIMNLVSPNRHGGGESTLDAPHRRKLDELFAPLARFRGTDKIGIVPDGIIPRCCASWFSGESITDFINFPSSKPDRGALFLHIHWMPLGPIRLSYFHCPPPSR